MKLLPIAGINNVANDDALQIGGDNPRLFVKDAINVDISETGRISLRKSESLITNKNYRNIWQSPLHRDVFATLDRQLVKINTLDWSHDVLLDHLNPENICYEVLNNIVYISTAMGIFIYNGFQLEPLTVDNPASPLIKSRIEGGKLGTGDYVVAISYSRYGKESGLSEHVQSHIDILGKGDVLQGSLVVQLPYCLDASISQVNIYCSARNGSELRKYGSYPVNTSQVIIDRDDHLGRANQFNTMSAMPSGKFMKYWQGRLLTADKNILRFSQAMAYHLHDERHDFIMLPQRISFILPVDGGIWVGQVDHVVFLSGAEPSEMTFVKKTAHSPIPYSAVEVDSDLIGADISQGGGKTALWLSENGYVIGTSTGQIIELHSSVLNGITAKSGRSVSLGRRLITLVS
ncbi:hypothetical protein ACG904_02030 [Acinetobacter guillouiae]|uniref:hypothetical protein n=1 Tax=Acinetobacter guillouiae TaxID=106649 RepID=UPI003AF4B9AC